MAEAMVESNRASLGSTETKDTPMRAKREQSIPAERKPGEERAK